MSVVGYKVTKATSVSNDGKFFMEILDGGNKIEKIDFVSSSGGAIKNWTLSDSLVVKNEEGKEITFRIHGNKGPVYLVTEIPNENGKLKKYRVTFYIESDGSVVQPKKITLPKQNKERTTSQKEIVPDNHSYIMTDEDRGYDVNGKPVKKDGEPMRAFNQRMVMWGRELTV